MHCDDGFTPLFLVEAHRGGFLAIEHGPVPAKRHAALFQNLGQYLITTALFFDIYAEEMRAREMLILAKHSAKRHNLIQCGAGDDKPTPRMRKDRLLLKPDRRAKVMCGFGVEVGEEAVEVVVVDIRVEFDEEIPLRLGPHVRGPLHHGQEHVLVEGPAVDVFLVQGRGIVGLDAVVEVKVWVVELVLGPQVDQGIGDIEAVVCVFAVREDEQVQLAAAQAVEEERQGGSSFASVNLQDNGHVVHDAGGEGRAFFAKEDLGDRAGAGGRRAVDENLIAALAGEEAGQQGEEEIEAQDKGGAQQAQRCQSHHHGGEVLCRRTLCLGEGAAGRDAKHRLLLLTLALVKWPNWRRNWEYLHRLHTNIVIWIFGYDIKLLTKSCFFPLVPVHEASVVTLPLAFVPCGVRRHYMEPTNDLVMAPNIVLITTSNWGLVSYFPAH